MQRTPIDPERLALLLDGRLGRSERDAVVSELARGDERTLGAFADASALIREMQPEAIPARTGKYPSALRWAWLPIAAVLLLAVLVPVERANRTKELGRLTPRQITMSLSSATRAPAIVLPETRGAAPNAGPSVSVRIGVLLTDLELATRDQDLSARDNALAIASLVENQPAGAPSATVFRDLARQFTSGAPVASPDIDRASATLDVVEHDALLHGVWLEAARNAAIGHDAPFFKSSPGRAGLEWVSHVPTTPTSEELLRRLRRGEDLNQGEWSELANALEQVIQALTR